MEDPTYEVHYFETEKWRTLAAALAHEGLSRVRKFGKTESQEALSFAKSLPADAQAKVIKTQVVWSFQEVAENP